jgi:MFS-type transporter involved in bile tolerance (Atg22 family)
MFNLFFGDLISTLTTTLVIVMLIFAVATLMNRKRIQHWGRRTLVFILVGTAISGLSAVRDSYMTEVALFAPEGLQSSICSVAGGLIFLTGIILLFAGKQDFRRRGFFFITILFAIQVVTIEVSRIAML